MNDSLQRRSHTTVVKRNGSVNKLALVTGKYIAIGNRLNKKLFESFLSG